MEIIAFHNCADSYEARKKEQEYFEKLGATLNSIDPFPKPKIGETRERGDKKYFCECCDYMCCVKFSYDRHLLTSKHIKKSQINQNEIKKEKKITDNICECGQIFYSRTTLWRHTKKCGGIETNDEPEVKNNSNASDKDDLINYLIKENQELQNLILKIVKREPVLI
jgi:hypothetical protein